ncbi:MAG: hypothetical protein AB1Z98_29070 [Nannocystaceae bacterium]
MTLQIRREQVHTLSHLDGAYRSFVVRMVEHLREHFGPELGEIDELALAEDVQAGIERARSYRLTTRRDCARYLGLCASLGWDFDTTLPWVRPLLLDRARSPSDRIGEVFERAVEQLEHEAKTITRRRRLGM